jgi:2-C-methyl-D-erythritol 2,4-cyclodiphosphate synthase
MEYKVGIGYDIHHFTEGRKLFIGGVEIPYFRGLLGHSDADVLLHAICDAFLGAMGKGDIGEHFPETEPQYHGIAGSRLLGIVGELLKRDNYAISNIDAIVIAEEPKLSPFKKQMQVAIGGILGIGQERVNVKAKTNEGIDEIGKKEAIAAYATVVIMREA